MQSKLKSFGILPRLCVYVTVQDAAVLSLVKSKTFHQVISPICNLLAVIASQIVFGIVPALLAIPPAVFERYIVVPCVIPV
jgi:hypothetical protein